MISLLFVGVFLSLSLLESSCCSVLVYNDEGVDKTSFERTCSFFRGRGETVRAVDADTLIKNHDWMAMCKKLVIPGGADCPYHKKLRGTGCANIRMFVENGGMYVGICAGGYFGCKRVEFALGTKLEINEERELAFFPGTAYGPMLKPYVYDSEEGASAASVRSLIDDRVFYAYHNGGSTFVTEGVDLSNVTVLAEYADAKVPAVIRCKCGKGEAILSGVHYEADRELLLSTGKDLDIIEPIAEKIGTTATIKESFLVAVLK